MPSASCPAEGEWAPTARVGQGHGHGRHAAGAGVSPEGKVAAWGKCASLLCPEHLEKLPAYARWS